MRFDHIATSLCVIGRLEEGQKLAARNGLLSIDRRPSPFFRWLGGDNRLTTLMYINNVVNEAILAGIYEELDQAIPGLESLKVTYSEDIAIGAALDILIKKIKIHVNTNV